MNLQMFAAKSNIEYTKSVSEFKNKLENGEVNTKFRWVKQSEHIEGSKSSIKRSNETGVKQSVFYEDVDVERLIKNNIGKGNIAFNKSGVVKEYLTVEKNIGKVYNIGKEEWVDVKRICIEYNKNKGVHAYPVKDW